MPDFHIVQDPNALTFDDAKKAFSSEMREGLARAAARARIPEDDVFWGLLVALTELSNTGLEAQATLIKSILDKFVSARSADNQKLSGLLSESGNSIARQASSFAEQIESLKTAIQEAQQAERKARGGEMEQLRRQLEELRAAIPDVRTAAEHVEEINRIAVFWAIGGALAFGAGALLLIQHFVLHLF